MARGVLQVSQGSMAGQIIAALTMNDSRTIVTGSSLSIMSANMMSKSFFESPDMSILGSRMTGLLGWSYAANMRVYMLQSPISSPVPKLTTWAANLPADS